jgi:hypothetical protein
MPDETRRVENNPDQFEERAVRSAETLLGVQRSVAASAQRAIHQLAMKRCARP